MKIRDTSLLYRFANLLRTKDAPPMKDACEVFAHAGFLALGLFSICFLAVGFTFGLGLIGATSLAALGVVEPTSKALAVLMAVAAGIVPVAAIVLAIMGARLCCIRVKAERLEGTDFYRFATFHVSKDCEPSKTLWGLLGDMLYSVLIISILTVMALFIIFAIGVFTMAGFGVEHAAEPGFGRVLKVFAHGMPVLFAGVASFYAARWICKRATVEIAAES